MNSLRILSVFWLSLVFLASHTLAGSWHGSGGEENLDTHNPWWVQNTQIVRYCIARADDFSLDEIQLKKLFTNSLEFWQLAISNKDSIFKIGTQQFQEVSCHPDIRHRPELTLFFGPQHLTTRMRKWFGDRLNRVIGQAVRTNYDREAMRAKGFIYIASSPSHDQQWQPAQLQRVLIHEIGHIFGLQHIERTVMDTNGPMVWAHRQNPMPLLPQLFNSLDEPIVHCEGSDWIKKFAPEFDEKFQCLRITMKSHTDKLFFQVDVGDLPHTEWHPFASIEPSEWRSYRTPLVKITIPKEINDSRLPKLATASLGGTHKGFIFHQWLDIRSAKMTRTDGASQFVTMEWKPTKVTLDLIRYNAEQGYPVLSRVFTKHSFMGEWFIP